VSFFSGEFLDGFDVSVCEGDAGVAGQAFPPAAFAADEDDVAPEHVEVDLVAQARGATHLDVMLAEEDSAVRPIPLQVVLVPSDDDIVGHQKEQEEAGLNRL